MSALKQLWLAVVVLMSLLFVGTTALHNASSRENLQQGLQAQTAAEANLLALHLQANSVDGNSINLQLPEGFDTRKFDLVQIAAFDGTITASRDLSTATSTAPAWFTNLFPIGGEASGVPINAQGNDGNEIGVVTLVGNSASATSALWKNSLQLALFFAATTFLLGVAGSLVVQRILNPLGALIEQAEALTGGEFTTMKEPSVKEYRHATRAMNNLSDSVQTQKARQSQRSNQSAAETSADHVTGLAKREELIALLKQELRRKDAGTNSSLCILHLNELRDLNQLFGRQAADDALREMGRSLNSLCLQYNDWCAARLNGADFALLAARNDNPLEIAQQAQAALTEVLVRRGMHSHATVPGATTIICRGESVKDTLSRIDGTLAAAIGENKSKLYLANTGDVSVTPVREQVARWRTIFEHSFAELNFSLATFPVAGLEGELLHLESPARLEWQGKNMSASEFLPWINCLELNCELDKRVIELALAHIKANNHPLCIHLSGAAISDTSFLQWLNEKLSSNQLATRQLWIEFDEDAAFRYLDGLRLLAVRLRLLGCKIGIEHAGNRLSDIGRLRDVEIDYLKIDGRLIRAIDQNRSNQALVRTLCAIGKARNVLSIAEGVSNDEERNMLKALGVDGLTGPGVKIRDETSIT